MPHAVLSAVVARVGRAALRDAADPSDGRLLARFTLTRDEPAFRELVDRLGPMVLGVCRRVVGDAHLAEDAFQAAFLVLARRAADVRPREAVRGWMYGVAVRTAQKARGLSARRRTREVPTGVPHREAPAPVEPDPELLQILDEEIGGLPDHLRVAVVLCEIEGVTRLDAAKRLGIPAGTLSSRLAKARTVLAGRLKRRGVALPAAGLALLGTAAVSPRLAHVAVAVATSGPVPPAVAALSNGVFRTMFLQKLKLAAASGTLFALAWVLLGVVAPSSAQEPSKPGTVPDARPDAKKP